MPEFGVRSTYSQCPFQLHLCDEEGLISTATAFFYDLDGKYFLVTTWHNVSGRNSFTGEYLSPSRKVPTYAIAKLATYLSNEVSAETRFTTQSHKFDIYNTDLTEPLWLEHPELGSGCDVVALPFNKPDSVPAFMHNAANKINDVRIPITPGCQIFIIGFPHSISVGFGLPIWKSGYIASEPHYDITLGGKVSKVGGLVGGRNLPAFFVDALSRKGLSGSPVFAAYTGNWDMTDPYQTLDPRDRTFWSRDDVALGMTAYEFVGIYSGRIGARENEAALGLCWKKDIIMTICRSNYRGKHPH